jgi:uncharacterized protein YlzI (FlbEa/FlbD family)
MIELTGLNGATILVAPKSIYRVRGTVPSEGADATKVEYSGAYLYTHEPIDVLIARLSALVSIIKLTSRSGLPIWLNAGAITQVREALALNGSGTEITIAGHYQHVVESVDAVRALL